MHNTTYYTQFLDRRNGVNNLCMAANSIGCEFHERLREAVGPASATGLVL